MRHMHRFSVDEIRSSYAGLEAAFLAGDYLLTAEFAPAGSELAGCSLALCGLLEAGEAALAALAAPGAMARLCLAFVQWSLGRPAEAKRELEALLRAEPDHALARDLLALVMAPTIPTWCVSVALPIQTSASKDSRAGEYRYNQFLVRNVGTQLSANALDYQCSQSFAVEIAATPAPDRPFFVFSGTPQWFIPRDLKAAGIPTILWCHDTELFYHRMSDNYNIFDISVVCTSQEHFEVSRASGSVAASNFFGDMLVLPFFGAAPDLNKEWDLIFTGTTLDSEQTDRVTFLWQLSALSERFKVLIVDGHLHEIEYLKLLGRGKFSPVISRYRGCPSPRWRDALSRGTFVLYPAETTYRHFSPGCFPFRPEHLAEDITRHLEAWNTDIPGSPYNLLEQLPGIARSLKSREQPRDQLFDRTLKFWSMLVLLKKHGRLRAAAGKPGQAEFRPPDQAGPQRWVWPMPGLDAGLYRRHGAVEKAGAVAKWRASVVEQDDEHGINNTALIHAQMAYILRQTGAPDFHDYLRRARAILDYGLTRYPQSLALHWNSAHWQLFLQRDQAAAARLFQRIFDHFETFPFQPLGMGLGLPCVGPQVEPIFWDYGYGDFVLAAAVRGNGVLTDQHHRRLADVLRATAAGYLGWIAWRNHDRDAALDWYRRAIAIDGDNIQILWTAVMDQMAAIRSGGTATELAAMFQALRPLYWRLADLYPRILLTCGEVAFELWRQFGDQEELRDLISRWYRLRRIIDTPSGTKYFPRNDQEITHLLDLRPLWPPALASAVARHQPTDGSHRIGLRFIDGVARRLPEDRGPSETMP